ncbi:MAG: UDP-N-acetylmuramoyl-L-alanyl-D-glutamate--2,6-diaminopimelate ligase [Pseudomonadota bacterium]
MSVSRTGIQTLEDLDLLTGTTRAGSWSEPVGEITGLSNDSRKTEPGHVFFGLPGSLVHGAEFMPYAARMGAAVIVTDAEGIAAAEAEMGPLNMPVLVSENPRRALARAASRWYRAQPKNMVAVTGTNGKTSVASFTRQIWEAVGKTAVNLGTTGVEGAVERPLGHTTPDPLTLHSMLADLTGEGITHGAMEASSHGLAQSRLDGVHLSAAGFTNITRDHLDYHASFEEYLNAKALLFTRLLPKEGVAVVNVDVDHGPHVAEAAERRGIEVLRVGRTPDCALRIVGTRFDGSGQDLRFSLQGKDHVVRLNLIGGFQAENALIAGGLALATGVSAHDLPGAMERLSGVRGRMQEVARRDNGAPVFVDYAHTPDALKTALRALRPHVLGRLVVVFGAGGDRDPGKRPLMGEAVAQYGDVAFVTDDNPRSEDPALIRRAVLSAIPQATEIGDRAEAILSGVDALQPGDALLIAGKGHETGQEIDGTVLPFDDAEQASIAVAALEGRMP